MADGESGLIRSRIEFLAAVLQLTSGVLNHSRLYEDLWVGVFVVLANISKSLIDRNYSSNGCYWPARMGERVGRLNARFLAAAFSWA